MHFLLTFQEVRPISKTRNLFTVKLGLRYHYLVETLKEVVARFVSSPEVKGGVKAPPTPRSSRLCGCFVTSAKQTYLGI